MSAYRDPVRAGTGAIPPAPAPLVPPAPAPLMPAAPAPLMPAAPVDPALAERHREELERDRRVERRLTWRELGCLAFVAIFVLVRRRYLD